MDIDIDNFRPRAMAQVIPMLEMRSKKYKEKVALGLIEPSEETPPPAQIHQLPSWTAPFKPVPNMALRSALFGVIKKGKRRYMKQEFIAALGGMEVTYTGIRLDQADLDVYESLLYLLREEPLGKQCKFTLYSFLKLIGLTDTSENRKSIDTSFLRLRACALIVNTERSVYMGNFVESTWADEETQEWLVSLNLSIKTLFTPDQYTLTQWDERKALAGHHLAQWIHCFYAGHTKPYPIKIEMLHKLSRSEFKCMRDFKEKLIQAIDAVVEASGGNFLYEIIGDLIHVVKTPSAS
jgi:hypothetical protein